jgi:acyl dehydratase
MEQLNSGGKKSNFLLKVGDQLHPITQPVLLGHMIEFEKIVWDRGVNSHTDTDAAKKDGISKPLASGQNQMAFVHELLEKNFGDSWVYGGRISIRYIHPVYAGDKITARGTVTEISDLNGKSTLTLMIWCENQDEIKTAAGTAYVGQPEVSCSW